LSFAANGTLRGRRRGRRPPGDPHRLRSGALGVGLSVAGGVLGYAAVHKFGFAVLFVPVGLVVTLLIVLRPRLAVALPVVYAVLFEAQAGNALVFVTDDIHDPLPGHASIQELLILLAIAAVLLDALRHNRMPVGPAPFGPALALIVVGEIVGSVVGRDMGSSLNHITEELRGISLLLVLPWLVVNVTRDTGVLRRAICLVAALTVFKAGAGLVGVALGQGYTLDGGVISYYEATTNWLCMTYLMGMIAAFVAGIDTPRWARWGTLLVAASLLLSFRRSFWLATLATLPLVLVVFSGRGSRRMLIPALAVIAGLVWAMLAVGVVTEFQGPIAQRVNSLSPSRLVANAEDRYRIDERHNVLAAIGDHPLTGLGLAVPWKERYPLGVEHPGGQEYSHVAALWWWMKLGVIGLIAYLVLFGSAIVVGFTVFRRHPDPSARVAGAALAAGFLGLAVAETTATFTGVDPRATVVFGAAIGLLAAAHKTSSLPEASLPEFRNKPLHSVESRPAPAGRPDTMA
jgi:hypothetical protein